MSFLAWYFLGAVIMMAIAIVRNLIHRQIKLSDRIVLPFVGMLSFGGVAVILVALFCRGIEMLLDETDKNRIIWEK